MKKIKQILKERDTIMVIVVAIIAILLLLSFIFIEKNEPLFIGVRQRLV